MFMPLAELLDSHYELYHQCGLCHRRDSYVAINQSVSSYRAIFFGFAVKFTLHYLVSDDIMNFPGFSPKFSNFTFPFLLAFDVFVIKLSRRTDNGHVITLCRNTCLLVILIR